MKEVSITNKLAQSASAFGAGLLGFGVGAKWGFGINSTILFSVLMIGAIVHVGGMYVMKMKEQHRAETIAKVIWVTAWLCLLTLITFLSF